MNKDIMDKYLEADTVSEEEQLLRFERAASEAFGETDAKELSRIMREASNNLQAKDRFNEKMKDLKAVFFRASLFMYEIRTSAGSYMINISDHSEKQG